MHTSAVILTGGSGTRMKNIPFPKQFKELLGKPLFLYSLATYETLPEIDEVILVANGRYLDKYQRILKDNNFKKLKKVVKGGATRLASVMRGVKSIDKAGMVVLQEGSNPLTSGALIKRCIKKAGLTGACSAFLHPRDTVVTVEGKDMAASVLERARIAYTCAPQVYSLKVLKAALAYAKRRKITESPVVSLVRRAGYKVKLALSEPENLKVTTDADIYAIEHLLKEMQQCQR